MLLRTFSIPVAIAAIVQLKQSAPLFEITFLQSLLTMQFVSIVATSCISLFDKKCEKQGLRAAVITLYLVLDFSFCMAFMGGLRKSKVNWLTIKQLSQA